MADFGFDTWLKSASDEGLVIAVSGRVTADNAPQLEANIADMRAGRDQVPLTLDLKGLEYISSAGLRVLLRLAQSVDALTLENVSPEVYDIFDMTGMSQILDVRRALREISVEGCEVIGRGGNGTVYRLDEDTIVKVYKPWVEIDAIERERDFARTAFINGVPSVIAYDMVLVDDCLGVVFEMIHSDTLGHAMRDNPDKLEEYVDKYVELAKTLHTTHVSGEIFTDIHDVLHERADKLGQWCSAEEISLLHSIIESIPHTDTLTHNDLHPGNIMIQDGELLLIDMPEVTLAPPICDLASIFRAMISAPENSPDGIEQIIGMPVDLNVIEQSIGMPADLILKAGYLFFEKYTGITDPTELEDYLKHITLLHAFNMVFKTVTGSERVRRAADAIMNNLLRGMVIPNEQTIRELFQTM